MDKTNYSINPVNSTTAGIPATRLIQVVSWMSGLMIFGFLVFAPEIGVILFWNILIPVAPAILVLATGLWRNICPLATTNLLPRHFGWSKKNKLSARQSGWLSLVSIIFFFIIVPWRHPLFNHDGRATALVISVLALTGITMGFWYEWKSGWCSTLCPVHPIEKLYGQKPAITMQNWHCRSCANCSIPCPDSTPGMNPGYARKTGAARLSGLLTTGGTPGFIWGWFQVPDTYGSLKLIDIWNVYYLPLTGLLASLIIYFLVREFLLSGRDGILTQCFAAAAVSCYYWYRIPSLFGFCEFDRDGILLDLNPFLPAWSMYLLTIPLTVFFAWWLIYRQYDRHSWLIRPAANKR